ncbi:CDP-alcohol phosphatidyltransferase family protein [Clostridium disporicum]|uniref:CDP-alcohol phosphatidyltransferase n=1 Tax=Clostridium disporicum TaxID=84024 RepID=A0A174F689_9CLOT|nr:CDP-alcohol phosphatidyltransferase family protein [Clostridium disporicum]CUO43860.1 CDP-alcohol phosphatidyltransferase [Clostridium disporicum]
MKYREIREKYQGQNETIVDAYATSISPIITKWFLTKKFTPNEITIMMILSGIIGAILFSINSIILKMLGIVFIHMWYILDCSDGEVARIKKQFSKFGTEIDYSAHILNHPLFNISFAISLISLNRYNIAFVLVLTIILISIDGIFRNLYAFEVIYKVKMEEEIQKGAIYKGSRLSILKRVVFQFVHYPNYALIFPIIFVSDYFIGSNIAILFLISIITVQVPMILKSYIIWIKRIKDVK